MYWTNEANAKLFVGVLEQMRGRIKLDYDRLASHMGSDCTACAIEQQILKLKRQANNPSPTKSTPANSNNKSTSTTPSSTPKKRRADQSCTSAKVSAKKTKLNDKDALSSAISGAVKRDVDADVVFVKAEQVTSNAKSEIKKERL
ncbi:hypothetical protein ASPBRDRAFT_39137 [Aspergillus brasiliensis CBS 101740]|uniref:Uncharacterized protein n=1 Tax=Aspergillus brasiliensis (strain CBS 101740 / IMI 381727 / IBT 21946) TaxID=767769 RepID=A0A1L9UY70_ASPBC|nr:hypothetical protein ASPBRDRAFT_39137 [Aspergillus brasiliensis CBS 101740]